MKYQIVTHRNGQEHDVSRVIDHPWEVVGDPAEHILLHVDVLEHVRLPIDINLSDVITLTFRQVTE